MDALFIFCKILFGFDYRIYDSVLHTLARIHPIITIEVFHDSFFRLPAIFGEYFSADLFGFQNFDGLNLNIR